MPSPILSDLIIIARQAGSILRSGYGKKHTIKHKGAIDLATEIDQKSESLIINSIQSQFPDHSILAEESGKHIGLEQHQWIIDPLDGTTNYAHDVPIFCVSIAYAKNGEVVLGVIYDPLRDDCFTVEKGKGAYLNNTRLSVSDASDLKQSLLVTGFPYNTSNDRLDNLDFFTRFSRLSQGVRRLGSAALDLAYVAAGRFDGFWELHLSTWDIAAGALMVEEAGGKVTNIDGESVFGTSPHSILAASPLLHSQMLSAIHQK
jgi:myo-inositol-1(or 4)-monophosphatase